MDDGTQTGAGRALVFGLLVLGCELNSGGLGGTAAASAAAEDGGPTEGPGPSATGSVSTDAGVDSMSGSATSGPTSEGSATVTATSTSGSVDSSGGDGPTSDTDAPGTSSSGGEPPPDCTPILAETLTSLDGSDDGREWVVLYNPCDQAYDLGALSLAWGEYAYDGAVALSGMLPAGSCRVVGGPTSNSGNFDPPLGQTHDFNPNLSREPGAIGLFALPPADVDAGDVPVDVVIYGNSNGGGFRDPTGAQPGPVLPGNTDLVSMRRTGRGNSWEFASPPTPAACPSF